MPSNADASHGGLAPRADPISVRFHICLHPLFCGFVDPISSLSGAPLADVKMSIEYSWEWLRKSGKLGYF